MTGETSNPLSSLIQAYKSGGASETAQFDFLIGSWNCKAKLYNQTDGTVNFEYAGCWRAEHIAGKRAISDTFTRLDKEGEEIGSVTTLRTYSNTTKQWEMTVLGALEGVSFTGFRAKWCKDEMRLKAAMPNANFRGRIFNIQKNSFLWEGEISSDNYDWQPFLFINAERM